MNCAAAQQLLHLNRPGDRTASEDADLRAHLFSCPACASEADRIANLAAVELRWRQSDVPVPDLRHVRARVLAATSRSDVLPGSLIDRLLRLRARPAVRVAYGTVTLAAMVWFAVGQTQVRFAQAALHQRAAVATSQTTGPEVVYAVDRKAVALAVQAAKIDAPSVAPSSGDVEVAQSDLDEIIRLTEHELLRAMVQGTHSRARLAEVARHVRSAIVVTIRFRSPGA